MAILSPISAHFQIFYIYHHTGLPGMRPSRDGLSEAPIHTLGPFSKAAPVLRSVQVAT